jgi:hypothetical protein
MYNSRVRCFLSASQATVWPGRGEVARSGKGPAPWGLLDWMHTERCACNLV